MDYKRVVARNVSELMAKAEIKSTAGLAKRMKLRGLRVSPRTVGYLLDQESPISPKLSTITLIAEFFRCEPWMLLTSDFDPLRCTAAGRPHPLASAFVKIFDSMPEAERRLLISTLTARGVPDNQLEHLRAPALAEAPKTEYTAREQKRKK